MQSSARLYFCCRCQTQVIICSRCDRGHRYCTKACADTARSASLNRAGKKYQSTRAGCFNNAARQQRHRERKRLKALKVTHQGSLPVAPHAVLKTLFTRPERTQNPDQSCTDVRCHHCGALCEPFLRLDCLQQSRLSGAFRRSSTVEEWQWQ